MFLQMQNRMAVLLCNLKPAKMRGVVSQAMVMCASSPDKVEILDPPSGSVPGERVTCQGFPGKTHHRTLGSAPHAAEFQLISNQCYKTPRWRSLTRMDSMVGAGADSGSVLSPCKKLLDGILIELIGFNSFESINCLKVNPFY